MEVGKRQIEGQALARNETVFDASATQALDLCQLLELLGPGAGNRAAHQDAVACFVAGAEGWEDAVRQLSGAFSEAEQGLTDGQAE